MNTYVWFEGVDFSGGCKRGVGKHMAGKNVPSNKSAALLSKLICFDDCPRYVARSFKKLMVAIWWI